MGWLFCTWLRTVPARLVDKQFQAGCFALKSPNTRHSAGHCISLIISFLKCGVNLGLYAEMMISGALRILISMAMHSVALRTGMLSGL